MPQQPNSDCALCPRLCAYRAENRAAFPDKHNAPVPSFGDLSARLLIVGLAPGLRGANFTGRPFTGDYAGDLLYKTLLACGLATGVYAEHAGDSVHLNGVRITNAVRCVPPENKPTPDEIKTCRPFLVDEIAAMPNLGAILTLGLISHGSVIRTLGLRRADYAFTHGAVHRAPGKPIVINSYHCSRYNTNTGRLTEPMFKDVFTKILNVLSESDQAASFRSAFPA